MSGCAAAPCALAWRWTSSTARAAARGPRLDEAAGEAGQLGVREWLEELRDPSGEPVAEQVVGRAAERDGAWRCWSWTRGR